MQRLKLRARSVTLRPDATRYLEPVFDSRWVQSAARVSVVMPCLNESSGVRECVAEAFAALDGRMGEVIVVDNMSTDGSPQLAAAAGAKVFCEQKLGYGFAYLRGLAESQGRYLVLVDSDRSYDISAVKDFLTLLEDGYDVVIGSRIRGTIMPGAMPWLHRFVGVPALTALLNVVAGTRLSDAHCGFRAMTQEVFEKLGLETGGMEFASEVLLKAALHHFRIAEIPIVYHPRRGRSKLNPIRDGWRHLSFILTFAWKYRPHRFGLLALWLLLCIFLMSMFFSFAIMRF